MGDKDAVKFLTDEPKKRRLGIWLAFVVTYGLLDACWLGLGIGYLQEAKIQNSICISVPITAGMAVILFFFLWVMYKQGTRPTFAQWSAEQER